VLLISLLGSLNGHVAAFVLMVTDDGQDTQERTGDLQQVDSMPG
jgi:hypothetical protein